MTQTRYCCQSGLSRPYCSRRNCDLLVRDPLAHRLDLGDVGREIVARRQLDDDEDKDADADQRPHHDDEAADEKGEHVVRLSPIREPERVRAIHAEIGARLEIVGAVLRHVLQLVGDDHQLLDAGDDADREHLVRPERQDLVPDGFARRRRRRLAPFLLERHQLLDRVEVRLLAHLAARLRPKSPGRPLELVGRQRRELGRAHLRLQHRVLKPPPDRHLRLAGIDAVVENLALRRLDEERDADLLPVVADQLEHVGLLGLLAGRLDHDLQRPAVGQEPDAVRVALGQPEAVEKLVGEIGIVLRPLGLILVLEELRLRQHRVVRRNGHAVEDRVVDVVAVDRHRERPPEIGVAEKLAHDRIDVVQVGKERHPRALRPEPAAHLIAAPLLRLLQEGEVGEARDRRPAGRLRRRRPSPE